jgi:hypothetical protein
MIWLKFALIVVITVSMFLALWKTSVGILMPLAILWGYGWYTGFSGVSLKMLIIFTAIHIVIEALAFFLSNKYREANLAFTGAGITGFGTGILAVLFLGGLFGFFMWLGLIGRLITEPIAIGVSNITKGFSGGFLKVVYSTLMSAILAYILL